MSVFADTKNRRMVLLIAVVLAATLVMTLMAVPGGSVAKAAPESRARYTVTIPAAHFFPMSESVDYHNVGQWLRIDSGLGGTFLAAVSFPHPVVRVKRITMYAYDNDPTGNVCLGMYYTVPRGYTDMKMGEACSQGANTLDRVFVDRTINPNRVTGNLGPYLRLDLPAGSTFFYNVTILYTA